MRIILIFLFIVHFSYGCKEDASPKDQNISLSENDDDAARNFIRSALDNDFEKARNYILNDSANNQYIDVAKRNRGSLSKEENKKYNEASIQIHEIKRINDSISIVIYTNSYKKQNDSIKLVRKNGDWLVDLKYSFPASGN